MHPVEQPEQGLRQHAEPLAVIRDQAQLWTHQIEPRLQLGADPERRRDRGAGPWGHRLARAGSREQKLVALRLEQEAIRLSRGRHYGDDEVLLQRRNPAIGHDLVEGLVLRDIELFVLPAVGDRGPLEGVAVHPEIGALDRRVVAQDLLVGRIAPGCRGAVMDLVLKADAIVPAMQYQGLGDRQTLAIAPLERQSQLLLAGLQPQLLHG